MADSSSAQAVARIFEWAKASGCSAQQAAQAFHAIARAAPTAEELASSLAAVRLRPGGS